MKRTGDRSIFLRGLFFWILVLMLTASCSGSSSGGDGGAEEADVNALIISPSNDITISAGQSINFQAAVSGGKTPYTFLWTFDDAAEPSDLQDPGYVKFRDTGTYSVILRVTDANDMTGEDSITVTVAASKAINETDGSNEEP